MFIETLTDYVVLITKYHVYLRYTYLFIIFKYLDGRFLSRIETHRSRVVEFIIYLYNNNNNNNKQLYINTVVGTRILKKQKNTTRLKWYLLFYYSKTKI